MQDAERAHAAAVQRQTLSREHIDFILQSVCKQKMTLLGELKMNWSGILLDVRRRFPDLTQVTQAQVKNAYNNVKKRKGEYLRQIEEQVTTAPNHGAERQESPATVRATEKVKSIDEALGMIRRVEEAKRKEARATDEEMKETEEALERQSFQLQDIAQVIKWKDDELTQLQSKSFAIQKELNLATDNLKNRQNELEKARAEVLRLKEIVYSKKSRSIHL